MSLTRVAGCSHVQAWVPMFSVVLLLSPKFWLIHTKTEAYVENKAFGVPNVQLPGVGVGEASKHKSQDTLTPEELATENAALRQEVARLRAMQLMSSKSQSHSDDRKEEDRAGLVGLPGLPKTYLRRGTTAGAGPIVSRESMAGPSNTSELNFGASLPGSVIEMGGDITPMRLATPLRSVTPVLPGPEASSEEATAAGAFPPPATASHGNDKVALT
jgi:hypothetical protein